MAATTRSAPSSPSDLVDANGDSWARKHTSLASRRPRPAMAPWSRRNVCSRTPLAAKRSASCSAVTAVASGPRSSSGGRSSMPSVTVTQTPARRSVPCSVSRTARPSANVHRARAPLARAACLASGFRRPPCIRWTTNVSAPKSRSRYLPRRPTWRRGCPTEASGAGTTVLRAWKASGVKRASRALPNSAVRRSAWACTSGSSGIVGALPHRREHRLERGEHRHRVEQELLVAHQLDAAADEGLLRVQGAGGHGDGRRPVLQEPQLLLVGRTGPEAHGAVVHVEVVADVALGTVGHDLG